MVDRGIYGNRRFLIVVAPQPLVACSSQILALVRQSSSGPLFPRVRHNYGEKEGMIMVRN